MIANTVIIGDYGIACKSDDFSPFSHWIISTVEEIVWISGKIKAVKMVGSQDLYTYFEELTPTEGANVLAAYDDIKAGGPTPYFYVDYPSLPIFLDYK